jgi:KaiC/GvpD/RAD55 family RecA-like ATPase
MGYEDLDNVLLGGIPESYATVLTAPFCDERDLIVQRFLQQGVENNETTFYVGTDVSDLESVTQDLPPNFYTFVCNPRADMMVKSGPNTFTIKSLENLNTLNGTLTKSIRGLDEHSEGPRRICITILSDILLQHQAVTTKRWLTELTTELRARGFTTFAVVNPLMHSPQDIQAILGSFEGEIAIYDKETQQGPLKHLRVRRMYNQRYQDSELPLPKEKM